MRLLVGFDGSDGGHDALELARAIAGAEETSILVVTVMPYGPLPADSEALAGDTAAEAERLFAAARERLGELGLETRGFGGGSPAKVMTELAEGEGIDLIVVGSPHRGAIGRALIGSVADNLLHGSPRPVVVAPRGYAGERHEPFRRIAVGHDGTPEADAALRAAEALSLRSNALIDVLTVLAPPAVTPGPVGYAPVDPPEPDKILNEAIHSVDEGLGASGRRLDGPPARMLAGACGDADLLVVGSRGYGPVLRVLLGSVPTQLIHIAPCPVLVIPRPGPSEGTATPSA
jgi:nucleotide-binding universal stress UspA family protein